MVVVKTVQRLVQQVEVGHLVILINALICKFVKKNMKCNAYLLDITI